jgi:O-antigen/teichoic acid export membrane protein
MTWSIFGIALATVIAQSLLHLYLGRFAAKQLKISWWRLIVKNWLLAALTIAFAAVVRMAIPPSGLANVTVLVVIHLGAFLAIARVTGINLEDLRREKTMFQAMFSKQRNSAAQR